MKTISFGTNKFDIDIFLLVSLYNSMCNFMITPTRQCRLHPNKEICHIHTSKSIASTASTVSTASTASIGSRNDLTAKNIEITRLCNALKKKNTEIKQRELTIIALKKKIDQMSKDYDSYQIIKRYEAQKNRLLAENIDIMNFNNDEFHALRKLRNQFAHAASKGLPEILS
jgi:hypothetical protein